MSIPAAFDYHIAKTVDEAIALLQQYGDEAKLLAGGHSLLPTMKLRLAQPGHLIDLGRIDGLSYIREESDYIAIGALTTYNKIEGSALLHRHFALLPQGTAQIGDPQVRNRGTLGGSVAHADPAADMPGIVLALKATIITCGSNGTREIAADDFFQDLFATALEPSEVITEIRIPVLSAHSGSAYEKLANRASHYAVAGCATVLTVNAEDTCISASVAITGASVKPTRATAVENALTGKILDETTLAIAASHAADGLELVEDIHGSKAYRAQMVGVMVKRALIRASRMIRDSRP
jgi:aerobic carbon-monoxide dehydrogenase medium subunit